MHSLPAIRGVLLMVASLMGGVAASVPSAHASEPPPAANLTPVSASNAEGPLVFHLQCWPEMRLCTSAANLVLSLSTETTSIPGSTTVRDLAPGGEVLVYFKPDAALEPGVKYIASIPADDLSTIVSTGVALLPEFKGDPFGAVQIKEEWLAEGVGEPLSCTTGHEIGSSDGGPETFEISFFAEQRPSPWLTLTAASTDSWLFEIDRYSSSLFSATSEHFPLTIGVERCLTVKALNVLSLESQTRDFCLTAAPRNDIETVSIIPSELQVCHDPPKYESGEVASELTADWCRLRGAFCEHMVDDVSDCASLCTLCDRQRDGFAEWLCPVPATAGPQKEATDMPDAQGAKARGASCQTHLGMNAGTFLPLWFALGVGLAMRRKSKV